MLGVIGTIPEAALPLVSGEASLQDHVIILQGYEIPVERGTGALLAAAAHTLKHLGGPPPQAILAGDIGLGDGSRRLYAHLEAYLPTASFNVLVFHYLMPEVDWHNRVLFAVQKMARRPVLIADAGFMYAAKMSGQAAAYDLFTPDVGELAFLADETAPHPFYTRGFILAQEDQVPELLQRAYAHDNAARYVLVKGKTDYVAEAGGIWATVAEPEVPALEAVGGTGDTLTGIVAALAARGHEIKEACVLGAKANRLAGLLAQATPATPVRDLINFIPQALQALAPE